MSTAVWHGKWASGFAAFGDKLLELLEEFHVNISARGEHIEPGDHNRGLPASIGWAQRKKAKRMGASAFLDTHGRQYFGKDGQAVSV